MENLFALDNPRSFQVNQITFLHERIFKLLTDFHRIRPRILVFVAFVEKNQWSLLFVLELSNRKKQILRTLVNIISRSEDIKFHL
ncbi:hypothetical protein BpHYR1_036473 [Brachionus plicatilis]|uniref:Uncharacterized protein n=1 Tax=Brachionus plicatilis TaxID=10195 RepID=A0A3M7P852_BRAPC|nr:hypothetical protein BpHYR1_036473 [Brachionus plicatilis]